MAHFLENGVKLKKLVRLSHLVSSAGISRSSRMANDAIAADKIPITEPTPAVRKKITVVASAFYKQNQMNWEAVCSFWPISHNVYIEKELASEFWNPPEIQYGEKIRKYKILTFSRLNSICISTWHSAVLKNFWDNFRKQST